MTPIARAGLLFASLSASLASPLAAQERPVIAALVSPDQDEERGIGVVLQGAKGCIVLTPDHVVRNAVNVAITTTDQKRWSTTRQGFDAVGDVATLASDDAPLDCMPVPDSDTIARALQGKDPRILIAETPDARSYPLPVTIANVSRSHIIISYPPQAIRQGMSGSPLLVDGVAVGILLSTEGVGPFECPKGAPAAAPPTGDAHASLRFACILRLDYAATLLGPLYLAQKSAAVAQFDPLAAMTLLKTLAETRPTGDIGQVEAVNALAKAKKSLDGLDLAGLSFAGARLRDVQAHSTNFTFGDFTGATLDGGDYAKAELSFATLKDAKSLHTTFDASEADYLQAAGATFNGASLQKVGWRAANLARVSFAGANLNGASFAFSDLRGADFRGAKFDDLILIGADLRGARFDHAKVRSIDVTGALFDDTTFSGPVAQSLCATRSLRGNVQAVLLEAVPSTTEKSGFSYSNLSEYLGDVALAEDVQRFFASCPSRKASIGEDYAAMIDGVWEKMPETVHQRIRTEVAGSVLRVAGRLRLAVELVGHAITDSGHRVTQLATSNHYYRDRSKRILAELKSRLAASRAPATLLMTGEAMALLAAQLGAPINGSDFVYNRVRVEIRQREEHGDLKVADNWGPFFPPDMMEVDRAPEMESLFEAWAQRMKTSLPKAVRFRNVNDYARANRLTDRLYIRTLSPTDTVARSALGDPALTVFDFSPTGPGTSLAISFAARWPGAPQTDKTGMLMEEVAAEASLDRITQLPPDPKLAPRYYVVLKDFRIAGKAAP